jgi:hypothetical protein
MRIGARSFRFGELEVAMSEFSNVAFPQNVTPEGVALALLQLIARSEGISFDKGMGGKEVTREWILDTFHRCLVTARGANPERSR